MKNDLDVKLYTNECKYWEGRKKGGFWGGSIKGMKSMKSMKLYENIRIVNKDAF
jgi:hypothetical protein